jgi:hypothetical protein
MRNILVLLIVFCAGALAQSPAPERHVSGDVITSDGDPHIRIQLPSDVQYAGADRFDLYNVADCELHAFVEADAQKHVRKLYWVQFEGYLPSRPDLHHTYDSPRHTTIGGLDFYVDTWVSATDAHLTPGSDLEHIEKLIRGKGYVLPDGMMSVRLVHLLDPAKRRELMIIYSEDVASTGYSAQQLREGGNAHQRWLEMQDDLVKRATSSIKLGD